VVADVVVAAGIDKNALEAVAAAGIDRNATEVAAAAEVATATVAVAEVVVPVKAAKRAQVARTRGVQLEIVVPVVVAAAVEVAIATVAVAAIIVPVKAAKRAQVARTRGVQLEIVVPVVVVVVDAAVAVAVAETEVDEAAPATARQGNAGRRRRDVTMRTERRRSHVGVVDAAIGDPTAVARAPTVLAMTNQRTMSKRLKRKAVNPPVSDLNDMDEAGRAIAKAVATTTGIRQASLLPMTTCTKNQRTKSLQREWRQK